MNMKISFDCEDVIEELKEDISEFGENEKAYGVIVEYEVKIPFSDKTKKVEILVNYLLGEDVPSNEELEGGRAELSTLGELLKIFEEENRII